MKHVLLFFLSLFVFGVSFAQSSEIDPKQELQDIVELFQNDENEKAFTQFDPRESELLSIVKTLNDAETYSLLGQVYYYLEQDAKATEVFNSALELDPTLDGPHFYIGIINAIAGNLNEAEAAFRQAIMIDPENYRYHVELGRTLLMKEDSDGATRAFKTAHALNETNFFVNFSLANAYAEQEDFENSEKHYLAAIKEDPSDLEAQYNLGQLYQINKQPKAAITQFEKVVESDPNDWRALEKLVQENEVIKDYEARDKAVEKIYDVWKSQKSKELTDQGFYIRDQIETENGKIYALEYFELVGERPRKYVFKLKDEQSGEIKFDVSLGSYDHTTNFSRAKGTTGPDERLYHLDGYAPNGSHFTYGFFDTVPPYSMVKDLAINAFEGKKDIISSTIVK